MHSLLASVSGISVNTAEIAEPIAPANKINNINNFIENLAIFLTFIKQVLNLIIIIFGPIAINFLIMII
ncbi:hypothetical protein AYK20_02015 [Thermoplasmatales archaeon SG8-52-1]|nr:MAG: hypothetical protein AYK20_02015 [Thermoplasmatales archaeon SG8-52-1]